MIRFSPFIFLLCLLASACSKKPIEQTNTSSSGKIATAKLFSKKLKSNHIDYKTFNARIKVKSVDSKGTTRASGQLRMKKDEVIWMSLGKLGFEGVRAKITPKTVEIINRLERKYYKYNYSHLEDHFDIDLTFAEFQDMLIGNAIRVSDRGEIESEVGHIRFLPKNKTAHATLTIDQNTFLLSDLLLEDELNQRSMSMHLSDYKSANNKNFAYLREGIVTSNETGNLNVELAFNQVDWDEDLKVPFNVPDHYERDE